MSLIKIFLLSLLLLTGFMLSCNQSSPPQSITFPDNCIRNHRISSGITSNLFGNNPLDLAIDLSSKPGFAIIGAKTDNEFGINAGAVFILYYSQGIWHEDLKIKPSDIGVGDWFGKSVDIYDDILVAGAPYKNCSLDKIDCGAAYIFRRTKSVNSQNKTIYNWTEEEKLSPLELTAGNLFGVDVAASKNIVAVGAHKDSDNGNASGAVYVYLYNGSTWNEEKLMPYDGESGDTFGHKIALHENILVVSAAWKKNWGNAETGAVYIYRDTGAYWDEEKIVAFDGDTGDHYGVSLAINSNHLAIGSPHNMNNGIRSGAVYIYKFETDSWILDAKITPLEPVNGGEFGKDMAISGSTLFVKGAKNGINRIYVFKKTNDLWSQVKIITPPTSYVETEFASPIAASSNALMIGAPDATGSAYIYCNY